MSFSWWCHDKNGNDLFDAAGINGQALGLAPNTAGCTDAQFRLNDIRAEWCRHQYKEKLADAARAALINCQAMVRANLEELEPHHCATCTCKQAPPVGWSVTDCERFLNIQVVNVWRAGGGW